MVIGWGLGEAWEGEGTKATFFEHYRCLPARFTVWVLSEVFNSLGFLSHLGGKGSLE